MKSKPHFIDHDIIIHFLGYMYFANKVKQKKNSGKKKEMLFLIQNHSLII